MSRRNRTRRRVLRALASASLLGTAGCAEMARFGDGSNDASSSETRSPTAQPPNGSPTNSPTAESTAGGTEGSPTEGTPDGSSPATDDHQTPGYKDYHWHGRLFFEIDGDLVDFTQPKYYLDNLQKNRPETVYFHFHKSAHGLNEWSNEKKVVTFARALNLLPGISYNRRGGSHVVTYEGTTYRDGAGTSVDIYRGTETINPATYQVQHNDNFWVRVNTGRRSPSGGSALSGKLLVDLNNRRLDFSQRRYVNAGSERFGFRDDGKPYTWYAKDGVTLAEALNTLPDVEFERSGGTPTVKYSRPDEFGGVYRGSDSKTEILTRQRWNDVDPASYTLQAGDILWVYVHTARAPDNEH